eukprot:TRINITY_DN2095_c0_g1_i1.p1 TRINITY_DN2095_c0_g1~~TRINITY_DN2095_c0_g1_i1.p1  ORF type:complete len:440 (-),score=87.76 TRINITY_DN2095_c0_g1_i1:109-1428(-)
MEIELKEITISSAQTADEEEEGGGGATLASRSNDGHGRRPPVEDYERDDIVNEDDEEATMDTTSSSDVNDAADEDEAGRDEQPSSYEEGDVVEIDSEEKALLPCFGKGESRRRCFLSTVVVVSIACLLIFAFQFFLNVLLNSTISAAPIVVSPFPIEETDDKTRYLVPVMWPGLPHPLPKSIDPDDFYLCPNNTWSTISYCPQKYRCGSSLNTSHTCTINLVNEFPWACTPRILGILTGDFLMAEFPAQSSSALITIVSVASSLIAMVSIITALVILIAKRDVYASPPPVPVNLFQWTRSRQARDSNVCQERLMLTGIFLIIPLLLLSGLLPLFSVKPSIDDLSFINDNMCYLTSKALTSDTLSEDVTRTLLSRLNAMHVILLIVTLSSLVFGFVLVLVLMALFIQRLYLVLCSKKYWIVVSLMLPFVFIPLIITSFFD